VLPPAAGLAQPGREPAGGGREVRLARLEAPTEVAQKGGGASPPGGGGRADNDFPGAGQQDKAGQGAEKKDETAPPTGTEGPDKLPAPRALKQPLVIPPDLPGASAPAIKWPAERPEREKAARNLYPPLPPLPPDLRPQPGPQGRPLTLSDLQGLALANNPAIKNALAGVQAARGAVIQAGAYPNPSLFWEADTVGTNGGGYQGGGFDQVIKGANKIKLARAAATMDLRNAELTLKKAQSDLATQVRSSYFQVLVALENVKVNGALARFTDNVYRVQVDLLAGGEAAPYEPMQLRPLALQARFNLAQAQNQYQASWRQLAAALALPSMPPTEVAGRVDRPVPVFDYDQVLAHVLSKHTDVLTALNSLEKARYGLEQTEVAIFPDPDVHVLIQKDYTTPPFLTVFSASFTFVTPVWDQNRGNILQAKGQLVQAAQQPQQARLQLTSTLADAYNRYTTARQQVEITRQQVGDQVRAYRGVYERHGQAPDQVAFGDVVTAQQTLATYIASYITALGLQWQAVVDVANLLQTDDLFQTGHTCEVAPVPELDTLPPVAHPPRRIPFPRHDGADVGDLAPAGGAAGPGGPPSAGTTGRTEDSPARARLSFIAAPSGNLPGLLSSPMPENS
jgi:cobalt-zinc-cadmium efflux system outer membrane protein